MEVMEILMMIKDGTVRSTCNFCAFNCGVLVHMKDGKVIGVSPLRLFISKIGNKILEYTFPQSFKTSTCILRGYKREVLEALELESNGKEIRHL